MLSAFRRLACTILAGGLLTVNGGSSTAALVDRINRDSLRPLPTAPAIQPFRPDSSWVPDRYVVAPGQSAPVMVPGHWEQRLSNGQVSVPTIVSTDPTTGSIVVFPGGAKEPIESRQGP